MLERQSAGTVCGARGSLWRLAAPHTIGLILGLQCGPQAREERVWRPKMAETLEEVTGSLVAELEARFPYAAALISSASGVQIGDNGNEQEASEEAPSRGA